MIGEHCDLAKRGYSPDGKKALPQIEYGLLTDPAGRPVAIRVVPGNTADPKAFEQIAVEMKTTFGLDQMVMVGDRGMITSARAWPSCSHPLMLAPARIGKSPRTGTKSCKLPERLPD